MTQVQIGRLVLGIVIAWAAAGPFWHAWQRGYFGWITLGDALVSLAVVAVALWFADRKGIIDLEDIRR